MTAVPRSKVAIYIVAANTNASALATTDKILGEIESYDISGGEIKFESDPVFGGYVDKEAPQSMYEIAFDIMPSIESGNKWEAYMYATQTIGGIKTYVSGGNTGIRKAVFIAAADSTPSAIGWGFNNCNVTVLNMGHKATENMTKKVTIAFAPTTTGGIPNFISANEIEQTAYTGITKLPNWYQLTSVL